MFLNIILQFSVLQSCWIPCTVVVRYALQPMMMRVTVATTTRPKKVQLQYRRLRVPTYSDILLLDELPISGVPTRTYDQKR